MIWGAPMVPDDMNPHATGSARRSREETEARNRNGGRAYAPRLARTRRSLSGGDSASCQPEGTGRLVAVSNRCGPVRGAAQAGGLAGALLAALPDRPGPGFRR